jgi:hypothetical protein
MAAYKKAAVKVTPPNDFPLGLIRSHMVIYLFLMLCDLQRVVRDLCPTLYFNKRTKCSNFCQQRHFPRRRSSVDLTECYEKWQRLQSTRISNISKKNYRINQTKLPFFFSRLWSCWQSPPPRRSGNTSPNTEKFTFTRSWSLILDTTAIRAVTVQNTGWFRSTLMHLCFLIKKSIICTIAQLYFGKELYMFRTDLLSIIRSLNAVFIAIGICHPDYVDCLLVRSGWVPFWPRCSQSR